MEPDGVIPPQIMDVAVQFKPILNVLPQTALTKNNETNTPILLSNSNNNYFSRKDNTLNLPTIPVAGT